LVVLLILVGVYWAIQQAPEFYEKTLQADPVQQAAASNQMLQQATALASNTRTRGPWRALFTADQINGWLAVDLVKNHPTTLPPGISDPRLQICPNQLALACRYQGHGIRTVLWLTLDAYLAEPNVIALRIKKVRVGWLPLPLGNVLDAISRAARERNLPLRWTQADGDPVALITIPPEHDRKIVRIETLKLGDNAILLTGKTESTSK
jgi:hypothetical protein